MSTADTPIEDLRREIDEIDTALHDLLMRRSDVAARIGALKNGPGRANGAILRPGREAAILRRLVRRHQGPLPAAIVVQIWREMMSALVRLQGPFGIAVYVSDQWPGYWDLARDHFGSHTPITTHDSTGQTLSLVIDGAATVAVLPLPQQDDRDPWWRFLVRRDGPRIIARLPFGDGGACRGPAVEALAVGRVAVEETGRDRTFLVLETSAEISRSALLTSLKSVGFEIALVHVWHDPADPATWLHLVELEGFVRPDDPRLARFAKRRAEVLRQIWPIGAYAIPFTRAELGASEKA
jgi:chorismate mutase-like protein